MAANNCFVRIVMTGHRRGEVFINGQQVQAVRGVRFMADVDDVNRLLIDLAPDRVEIEGVAEVEVSGSTEGPKTEGGESGR